MRLFDWLVYPINLTPHGYCLLWAPGLIWLHAGSDVIIGLAYFSIPLALAWFYHKRTDLKFRWVLLLFVSFILACGMTHFMSVLTLWVPAYGVEGLVKLATAILSVVTAILLWPMIPRLLALPSPAQLEALNDALSRKIEEQQRTYRLLEAKEEELLRTNSELEQRVAKRTASLTATNAELKAAYADLEGIRTELEATVQERGEALKQRDLLLREVYHRVKNNLQIVDSVVLMQSRAIDDPKIVSFFASLRARIYALGLVHQQLMTSSNLQTFDLAPFLRDLVENLVSAASNGEVELEVDACPLTVGLDYAVPLALIVTEMVTNSIKHGLGDAGGTLRVAVEDSAGTGDIVVTVADSGQGDAVSGDRTSPVGIGKKLIDGLLKQLNGGIIAEGKAGVMTKFFLPRPRLI